MDRVTKMVVVASMAVAVIFEAALMAHGWPAILPATVAALATFSVVGWRYPGFAAALVLLFTYTFPAIPFVLRGRFEVGSMTPWVAALIGITVPMGLQRGWALPRRWRTPLVLWALTVAVLWPVVALREADFHWMTLDVPRLSVTGLPGVPPLHAIMWSLDVALVLGVGILWFDWLFATFEDAERRFRWVVIGALGASWLATTSIGIYQLLFDVTLLNNGMFALLQRVSGLMFDANPFGVVAALGIPAIAAVVFTTSWRGRSATAVAVVAIGCLALWGSGSQTAFAAGVIGASFVLYYVGDFVVHGPSRRRLWTLGAGLIVLILVLAPILVQRLSAVGTWQRLKETVPSLTLLELWNRNGYGSTATSMIKEFLGFGVGVGAFHYLVLDFSRTVGPGSLPIDNAQNWYRHQLAEFGIVGSLGWIWWTLSFGWFVLTARPSGQSRWAAGAIRGALVAIALISTLGMPTQNLAVTLTFWTLAFWYVLLAGESSPPSAVKEPTPAGAWIAVAAVLAICVAGTAYSARHALRVPFRAAQFGWPYSYGLFAPETGPNGEFRWAGRRAVTVLDAPQPWMRLTVSVNHADVSRKPVAVTVWCDSVQVLTATLANSDPVTRYVRVPDGHPRIMLETWVNRVVRPADYGAADARELGLMVQWEFVENPGIPVGR